MTMNVVSNEEFREIIESFRYRQCRDLLWTRDPEERSVVVSGILVVGNRKAKSQVTDPA